MNTGSNHYGTNRIAALLGPVLCAGGVQAGVISTTPDVRTLSGGNAGNDYSGDTYLSLCDNGGANIQRMWLNFDLSAYAGKIITSDATLTLVAEPTYGGHLTGVALGANINDRMRLSGSSASNQFTVPLNKIQPAGFYRLAYP